MQDTPPVSLVEHFAELEDFRVDRTKRHELLDIMVIAICAVVGGADSWTDVELFGKSKMEWFDRVLGLPNGIPVPRHLRQSLRSFGRRAVREVLHELGASRQRRAWRAGSRNRRQDDSPLPRQV